MFLWRLLSVFPRFVLHSSKPDTRIFSVFFDSFECLLYPLWINSLRCDLNCFDHSWLLIFWFSDSSDALLTIAFT